MQDAKPAKEKKAYSDYELERKLLILQVECCVLHDCVYIIFGIVDIDRIGVEDTDGLEAAVSFGVVAVEGMNERDYLEGKE
jgi:hypothetical protein